MAENDDKDLDLTTNVISGFLEKHKGYEVLNDRIVELTYKASDLRRKLPFAALTLVLTSLFLFVIPVIVASSFSGPGGAAMIGLASVVIGAPLIQTLIDRALVLRGGHAADDLVSDRGRAKAAERFMRRVAGIQSQPARGEESPVTLVRVSLKNEEDLIAFARKVDSLRRWSGGRPEKHVFEINGELRLYRHSELEELFHTFLDPSFELPVPKGPQYINLSHPEKVVIDQAASAYILVDRDRVVGRFIVENTSTRPHAIARVESWLEIAATEKKHLAYAAIEVDIADGTADLDDVKKMLDSGSENTSGRASFGSVPTPAADVRFRAAAAAHFLGKAETKQPNQGQQSLGQ